MTNVITSTSTLTNLIQQSYDKMVEMSLRSEPLFRKFADKRPVDVTNPGSSVTFQIYKDLARVTGTLSETADVDSVGIPNTKKVSVTLDNRGNAVTITERLKLEALSAVDPAVADMIAFNMRDSLDALVYQTLINPATGRYDGTTPDDETVVNGEDISGSTSNDTLRAVDILKAVAKLRGANVLERENGAFIGLIHPDVAFDLRVESSANGNINWKDPHTYTEAGVGNQWNGELGIFGGVKFIESSRVEAVEDTSGDLKHKIVILGKQALVEAVTQEPQTVIGPVTDKLMRFRPVGWKGLLGWNIYRPEARYVITAHSSI